ncbi:MAG: hypothetical protein EHM13_04370, partial [Acidobacteria bacterium]
MGRARVGAVLAFTFLAYNASVVLTSSGSATSPGSGPPPQGQEIVQAPLNPQFVAYVNATADERRVLARSAQGRPLGAIPPPLDLWRGRRPRVEGLPRDPLPTSYDLRTLGKVTGVRDQNPFGTCWAHATFGSMESALLTAETWDFSENNLVNRAGFDLTFDQGGNYYMSSAYLARWDGPGNEADDVYPNPGASPVIAVRKHVQNVDFIPPRASPTDNSTLKQYVMDYGGVYTVMRWDDMSFNASTASFYYTGSDNTNHAVLIVGWDDAYPAANFSSLPPGNGAFLIKNSWGTSFGQSGYFWISYYDSSVATANAMFFAPEPTDNYDNIYQHDPLGWVSSLGYEAGDKTVAWFANIFTATGGQDVRAVSFYVGSANSPYEVYVYVNPTTSDPTSGTLGAAKTGTIASEGYHTVILDTA